MRLLIMGPPGAGKGTQAKYVAEHFKIPAISTGDIFRANVSKGTPLGIEAKRYMDAGEYVPDEVTNLMVRNRIDDPDAVSGFLLDGYPRTQAQVDELDGMIAFTGHRLDAVVVLTADRDEIVARLLQRAEVEGRADDTEDVIRRRQEVYAEETEPLIEIYRGRGILIEVDGMGEVAEVTQRIFDALDVVSGVLRRHALMGWRDRGIEIKTPEQVARDAQGRAGGRPHPRGAAGRRTPGRDHRRAGRHRRGRHPHRRCDAVVPRLPGLPGLDLHLGERRGRARHPR